MLLFGFLFSVYAFATLQAEDMKQHEENLIGLFYEDQKYVNNKDDRPPAKEYGQGTFWRFKKALKNVLLMQESIDYPFDSLSQLIDLHQSKDKRLRTLTWYAGGGTGSSFDQIFQFTDQSGKIHVQETGDEDGDFNNNYSRLEQISLNKKTVYFIFGWHSGGGGTYCRCVKALEIKGRNLIGTNVFKDSTLQTHEISTCQPRMYKNEIIFDPAKNEFSYDLYVTDEEMGFPVKTKNRVFWKLYQGNFIKRIEKI